MTKLTAIKDTIQRTKNSWAVLWNSIEILAAYSRAVPDQKETLHSQVESTFPISVFSQQCSDPHKSLIMLRFDYLVKYLSHPLVYMFLINMAVISYLFLHSSCPA